MNLIRTLTSFSNGENDDFSVHIEWHGFPHEELSTYGRPGMPYKIRFKYNPDHTQAIVKHDQPDRTYPHEVTIEFNRKE